MVVSSRRSVVSKGDPGWKCCYRLGTNSLTQIGVRYRVPPAEDRPDACWVCTTVDTCPKVISARVVKTPAVARPDRR